MRSFMSGVRGFAVLLTVLSGLMACTPYGGSRGGGGGGGGGGDDDDAADGTGPMDLTFSIGNDTGYDFTYLNWGLYIDGDGDFWENTDGMTDGSIWSSSGTVSDVTYGVAMTVVAYAVDVDADCYDWEDGGRSFNTGSTLTIEVDFTFDDWLGGGCP